MLWVFVSFLHLTFYSIDANFVGVGIVVDVLDCVLMRVVEWDATHGIAHMNDRLLKRMPNTNFIENIWI